MAKRTRPKGSPVPIEQWTYSHAGELANQLGLPPKEESVQRSKAIAAQHRAIPITIRVREHDLELARTLADRKGLPYQTYLKMLIHEALERDKAAQASP